MMRFAGVGLAAALFAASSGAIAAPDASAATDACVSASAAKKSDDAIEGARLFEAARWAEAAVPLQRVARGRTCDAASTRQLAGYRVAVALHHLGLNQASLGWFAVIADDPKHVRFEETFVWLAAISKEIADPDEVVALLGRYTPAHAAIYDNRRQRDLHSLLESLLGRYAYRARHYEEAMRRFAEVAEQSPSWIEAEFLTALAAVQLRKGLPAARAFKRIADALESGRGGADRARLRDLAAMSTARAYYSWALAGVGASCCMPTINSVGLANAVKGWSHVAASGPSFGEALLESAWAYFMAGDFEHALGNLTTLESPYFQRVAYPEAPVLESMIEIYLCRYDEAATLAASVKQRYAPIRRELAQKLARLDAEGGAAFFRFPDDVRAGRSGLGPDARVFVTKALSDRQLARRFAHARGADAESALFAQMPAWFRASDVGREASDALAVAHDLTARNAASLVRSRLARALTEIDRYLAQADDLLTAVAAAPAPRKPRPPRAHDARLPTSDDDHAVWPFDGEFWRDELGTYRVAVRSRCGD